MTAQHQGTRALLGAVLAAAVWLGTSLPAGAQESPGPAAETPSPAAEAPGFFFWTDTSLSLLPYGDGFAVDPKEQSTFTLEHAHESKIGDLFMFVDFTRFHGAPPGSDDTTWYGEFGPRLSFNKMFGTDIDFHLFKYSLFQVKDVLLAMQYERGEDADVAEAALLGLGFNLDVREKGLLGGLGKFNYVQLNLYGRAELTEGTRHGFHDMQVTLVASYPFKVGNTDWLIDGFFDWVTGFGSEDWSYNLNPQITMDLGAKWGKPKKLYFGIEVDLWWNKYQIPDSPGFDTDQAAISLLLKYHL